MIRITVTSDRPKEGKTTVVEIIRRALEGYGMRPDTRYGDSAPNCIQERLDLRLSNNPDVELVELHTVNGFLTDLSGH